MTMVTKKNTFLLLAAVQATFQLAACQKRSSNNIFNGPILREPSSTWAIFYVCVVCVMLCVRWVVGRRGGGPRGVEAQRGGGPKVWGARGEAQHFALFFPSPAPFSLFFFFFLGLLVELWSRTAAMDHPKCAFGLLWGHLVKPPAPPKAGRKIAKRRPPVRAKKGEFWSWKEKKRATFWAVRRRRGPAEEGPAEGGLADRHTPHTTHHTQHTHQTTHNTHNTQHTHTTHNPHETPTQDTHNAHTFFRTLSK